ncbi:hypothetical protein F1559_003947 [Cyanidiococcus yangmingshanensis]|uniref:Protein kinase domain-containing protein n=1 Tax=Cyanidiococcus yangmingshanensis TaxID=2690220 RepID=A0A7J7IQA4_9RHOD|nr:hypothetical protein F1559_003947 [Cyanidiococcus yangmingshanensis]
MRVGMKPIAYFSRKPDECIIEMLLKRKTFKRCSSNDDLVPLRSSPRSMETEERANASSSPDATAKVNVWSVEKRAPPDNPDVIFWRRVGVAAFVGGFVWWSHVLSIRNSDRVRLPNTYDPGAIASYFVLRPERVATRSISIVCEAIRYFLGVQRDQLEYRLFGAKKSPQNHPEQNATIPADTRSAATTGRSTGVSSSHRAPSIRLREYLTTFIGMMRLQLVRVGDMLITPLRKDDTYWVWRRQRRAVLLRQTLERLGPAFVKLGQALATRPDIIGEAAARELQRLQDDMPHFSNDEAFRFIRTELGAPPSRVFDSITENPVASASLGQVYKASLDGVDLAVKVQRPGIVERIALDFFVVRMLGELWMHSPWAPRTDLVEAIDEYASRLFEETDYGHEAENMRRFRQLYGSLPGIYVPEVYPEYSSAHVLTMEWVNGRRLIDETATVRRDDIPLIKLGILCSLMQLMETGFLHADPHTGNLLVTEDGSRLVYLDYGLMSEVPQSVQLSIICAVVHLINREYEQLATDFFGLTLMRRDDLDMLLPEFAEALRQTFESEHDNRNPADFTLQGVAENLLRMTVRFPFVMPLYFLNNLRALAMLEGLALNADPSFRIMDILYPYVVRRLLTDPSPQLQRALQELVLTPFGEPRWDRVEKLLDDAARTAPSMAMSSLDPRPVAVLEVAAQEAAEIARLRRTEQSDDEARATMSAYFRQSAPEASLMTNSSLNGVVDDSLSAHETHDESLTEKTGLVTLDEQRRMQMLITFMASQAGVFLRRALERQLADDWNDRVQAFLDGLEKRLLPGVLTAHEIPLDATGSQLDDERSDETVGVRAANVEAVANGQKSTTDLVRAETESTNGTEEWTRSTNGLMKRRHRSGPRLTTATRENRRRLSQIITHLKLKHWRALLSLAPVLMVFYARVFCAVAWRVLQRLGFDLGILVVLGWRALRTLRPLAILSKSRRATALQEASPNGSSHGVVVDEASTETKVTEAEEVVDQRPHSTRKVNASGNGRILNDHESLDLKEPARNGQTKAVDGTRWTWQMHSPSSSATWPRNGKLENGTTKASGRDQIK